MQGSTAAAAALDVFVVTYNTTQAQLSRLLQSVVQHADAASIAVHIWDNSCSPEKFSVVSAAAKTLAAQFAALHVHQSPSNMGFGKGNNALLARSSAPLVLLLNPDAALLPEALPKALARAAQDPQACAFEFRQTPFEHPKNFHPISLQTEWVSGAAVLFRREALQAVGGFEAKLFLYGEDVDLSWRLRAKGYQLRYLYDACVLHESYQHAGEVKPQQVFGSTLANVCLRARFGGFRQWLIGIRMLLREVRQPNSFPGRRWGLCKNIVKAIALAPYFRATVVPPNEHFRPVFSGWDFEHRRKGAFHQNDMTQLAAQRPLVSVLIRTHKRPHFLREALQSVLAQSYQELEVIVIEDGQDSARAMIEGEFAHDPRVRYHATGAAQGRSKAGNVALEMARGTWLNFLDDDDLFYPDHIETLLTAALSSGLAGVYGVSWEVPTEVISTEPLRYRELAPFHRYMTPFSHVTLWQSNFLPIQTVLFHRRLYEQYGGFETDMDQLEDWNLWTRYTLADRFAIIDKTTSLYRTPASQSVQSSRQDALDQGYAIAIERQKAMRVQLSPQSIIAQIPTATVLPQPSLSYQIARFFYRALRRLFNR
jgi:GT2 family glycosyltransferase